MLYFDARVFAGAQAGVYRYSKNLLDALLEIGIPVTLVSNKKMPTEFLNEYSGTVRFVRHGLLAIFPGTLYVLFIVKLLIPRGSIFLGVNHCTPIFGRNNFIFVHDILPFVFPETMTAPNRILMRLSLLLSLKRADKIFTVSYFTRKEVSKRFKISKKIGVIENDVSHLRRIAFDELSVEKAIVDNFLQSSRFILTVGSNEPRKNLAEVIRAFNTLCYRGYSGVLLLVGPEGWRNVEVQREIKSSPVSQRILSTGFVSDASLEYLYRNCDVFVFASLYEGYGIPILEALHFSAPMVCTTESESQFLNIKGPFEFFEPGVDDLAARISEVLESSDNRGAYTYRVPDMKKSLMKYIDWFQPANS